ncbi:MAG: zf-HC2 domain-containing protein [Bryobacterales bacterium]|nr:zf-HC2 domain-containing protein [Bryobacterales bacterium]
MKCLAQDSQDAALLLDYCERRLEPELAAQLERHLAVCPACARMVEAQRTVWEALDVWEPGAISADFNARLYSRILEMEAEPAWRRWLKAIPGWHWKPAMPLAAACLAILAVALWRGPAASDQPAGDDAIDVEQVERTLSDLDMLQQLTAMPADTSAPEQRY